MFASLSELLVRKVLKGNVPGLFQQEKKVILTSTEYERLAKKHEIPLEDIMWAFDIESENIKAFKKAVRNATWEDLWGMYYDVNVKHPCKGEVIFQELINRVLVREESPLSKEWTLERLYRIAKGKSPETKVALRALCEHSLD